MLFHSKRGWFPAHYSVALDAFTRFRTRSELALVGIGSVAVLAYCKQNLFLEIILEMAGRTGDLRVFAQQRVLGLRVIEIEAR